MHDAAAAAYGTHVRIAGRDARGDATRRSCARRGSGSEGSVPKPWEIALIIAVTVAIVVVTLLASGVGRRSSALPTRTVRVRATDTLWSLAQSNPVPGQATAATVEQIRVLNGLRASGLAPGTTLRVPLAEAPDRSYASR
jgi:LysM repeat protein